MAGRKVTEVPARVDFAGGWLDVPRFAVDDGYVVNCTIIPFMRKEDPSYRPCSGVGGSAAHAILNGQDPFLSEANAGVGWQDPAVILETGLCVWKSGIRPRLAFKSNGDMIRDRIWLEDSCQSHDTATIVEFERDYSAIRAASVLAARAVQYNDYEMLCLAVQASYRAQLAEGMPPVPDRELSFAHKYCGSGHGGYILRMSHPRRSVYNLDAGSGCFVIQPYLKPPQ